jgi:hypothetical protein
MNFWSAVILNGERDTQQHSLNMWRHSSTHRSINPTLSGPTIMPKAERGEDREEERE